MKRFMKIHYDGYKGGLYDFQLRINEFPGIAICPICGNHHMATEKEILTLKANNAPVCFRCKATLFDELLSEADIEFIVETEYLSDRNEEE